MAEGAPLLRVYRIYLLSRVRIPLSPPLISNPPCVGFLLITAGFEPGQEGSGEAKRNNVDA